MAIILVAGKPVELTERQVALFWSKVRRSSGCWQWMGRAQRDGYGKWEVSIAGRRRYLQAHRVAYQLVNGPTDSELDHQCRVRLCSRPDHLDAVTGQENKVRSWRSRKEADPLASNGNQFVRAGRATRRDRSSEHLGVSWSNGRRKWVAQISIDGRGRFLGHFESEEAAADACRAARARLASA